MLIDKKAEAATLLMKSNEPELDLAILKELVEMLGPEMMRIAMQKFERDVETTNVAMSGIVEIEMQRKLAHRMKGLMYQFGGIRAAKTAEWLEISERLIREADLKLYLEQIDRTTKLILSGADELISKGESHG